MNSATDVISKEAVLNSLNKMPDQIPIDALLDEIIYLFKVESALRYSSLPRRSKRLISHFSWSLA